MNRRINLFVFFTLIFTVLFFIFQNFDNKVNIDLLLWQSSSPIPVNFIIIAAFCSGIILIALARLFDFTGKDKTGSGITAPDDKQ